MQHSHAGKNFTDMSEEGTEVDGEQYDPADSFCYLSDILSMDRRVNATVTMRLGRAWTLSVHEASYNRNSRLPATFLC